MKKIMTVILSILMIIITIFSFSGCIFEEGPIMTYGDFRYCYVWDADQNTRSKNGDCIAILGLTEEGKQKEIIIIPETIEDKPVVLIGMEGMAWGTYLSDGADYDKLYIPMCLQQVRNPSAVFGKAKKIFLINGPNEIFFENFKVALHLSRVFYFPETKYFQYKAYIDDIYIDVEDNGYRGITGDIANLTYIVDDEVYWIDDYEDGEYIVFPEEPQKEGYVFDGWYKEPEGLTEWNEGKDKYSKSEDRKTVSLYAKWVQNQ